MAKSRTEGDAMVGGVPMRNFLTFIVIPRFIFHGELGRTGLLTVSSLETAKRSLYILPALPECE